MKKFAKAEGGCIYFGFKEGITREEFSKAIEESKTDKDAMERLLVKREVEIGDVVLVPAKAVHTIGAGALFLKFRNLLTLPFSLSIGAEKLHLHTRICI